MDTNLEPQIDMVFGDLTTPSSWRLVTGITDEHVLYAKFQHRLGDGCVTHAVWRAWVRDHQITNITEALQPC